MVIFAWLWTPRGNQLCEKQTFIKIVVTLIQQSCNFSSSAEICHGITKNLMNALIDDCCITLSNKILEQRFVRNVTILLGYNTCYAYALYAHKTND